MDEGVVPQLILPAETNETGLFCIDGDHTLIDGHTHNRIYSAFVLSKLIKEHGADWERIYETIMTKTRAQELRPQSKKEWSALFKTVMENNMWQRLLDTDKKIREETHWELVKHMPPIGGDPERWKSLFLSLIKKGHSVAMVSFSDYGKHILPRYLHEIIGLDKAFIAEHIKIISFLPKKIQPSEKGDIVIVDQSTKETHISMAKEETNRINLSPEKIVFCDDTESVLEKTCNDGGYIRVPANNAGDHIKELFTRCRSLKNPEMDIPVNKSSPYVSPRAEDSSVNPALAVFLGMNASPPSSPRILSSSGNLLRNSPTRAAIGRSSTPECGLESSGEHNPFKSSGDSLLIK